ncbi:LuxR C-terminal-related transcriptional regulator [Vibrio sp. SS-MA-C1-2]|uniref:helix-turn-helix transcriptional regulator n=1 Tax=Vibrio sp. SS-MA-C1-2 TaxID=2908646 RepID=UPI001F15B179|nr:LuxR C-terminal-related transcriptional regulator [Vibrio sp. SS-MA-C1-2]UJF17259.1 LuxR C-terminal-related transcriptional regulator [Vibrio sp. SS-MA-C1-2]
MQYENLITDLCEFEELHTQLFPELTLKEADCVYYLSMGLKIKEIASVMHVSESMIKKRIIHVITKLNTSNVTNTKYLYYRRVQNYYLKNTLEIRRMLNVLLLNTPRQSQNSPTISSSTSHLTPLTFL